MKTVTVYSLDYCPYCKKAKTILKDLGISFIDIDATQNESKISKELAQKYIIEGEVTYPQIIFGETRIGGYDSLIKLINNDKINEMLKEA